MDTKNKIHVNADDLIFDKAGEKENAIINKSRTKKLFSSFKKRAVASVIIGIVLAIFEYIGRRNQHIENTIGTAFTFIIVAVIVFNLLSFGYIVLKHTMDLYTDRIEILYCTVSEKYNQYKLSIENQKHSQNFILLETATHYCVTAFPVKTANEYNHISIGDTVLLLKNSTYGDAYYEIFTEIN